MTLKYFSDIMELLVSVSLSYHHLEISHVSFSKRKKNGRDEPNWHTLPTYMEM
jgi:hypothetical protein